VIDRDWRGGGGVVECWSGGVMGWHRKGRNRESRKRISRFQARLEHEGTEERVGASSPRPSPPQVCGGEGEEDGGSLHGPTVDFSFPDFRFSHGNPVLASRLDCCRFHFLSSLVRHSFSEGGILVFIPARPRRERGVPRRPPSPEGGPGRGVSVTHAGYYSIGCKDLN
jgi:hypothetical protein